MPTVMLTRAEDGKLVGVNPSHERGYAKWRKQIGEMGVGETVVFSFKVPRSGPYHGRFFAIVGRLFDMQEQFVDDKPFLEWLKVGAGYCDLVPGPKGKPVAVPKSINWETLDQAEFEPIAEAIFAFMRTEYCAKFLWPHANVNEAAESVNEMLAEFE